MRTRIGVGRKIVILIVALLIITAGAVLLINRSMFAQSMRTQMTEYQLPLVSDVALSSVSTRILRVSDALKLAAANPYFIDWMRAGEPDNEEEQVYRTVDSIIKTYGTLGANFISNHTHKYFDILEGQRYLRHVDETVDTWFTGFRDSGQQVSIVIYVGDPTWGTKAFINERVTLDGQWRGIMSASIDLQDMADELNRMKVGRHGAAFIVNESGMVRFFPDNTVIGKQMEAIHPAYSAEWKSISGSDVHRFSYMDNGDERMVITRRIPVLNWFLICEVSATESGEDMRRSLTLTVGLSLVLLVVGSVIGMVFARSITRPIERVADSLSNEASRMALCAGDISGASDLLDQGVKSQEAALDDTSAALRGLGTTIAENSDSTRDAEAAMRGCDDNVQSGFEAIKGMTAAMEKINDSSQQIGNIIKTIESISFQTNLLALNAAVEASRAGEAGKGFAVVADEVRNLAGRSAQATKDTADLIGETVQRVAEGNAIAANLEAKFNAIMASMTEVRSLIDRIGRGTEAQSGAIGAITDAMASVDKISDDTAARSGEMTAISANMAELVDNLRRNVSELEAVLVKRRMNALPAQSRPLRRLAGPQR